MLDNRLIQKINIGITIPKQVSASVVKKTLEFINYGNPFFINQVFLQEESEITNKFSFIPRLSSGGYTSNAAFFNQLINTKGADAFLLLEAGVEVTIPKLLKMIIHLNHFSEHCSVSPNLIYQQQLKNNHFMDCLDEESVKWKEKSLENNNSNCCYLVKKEIVEKIGLADVTYNTEDYWVLDYNVRANLKGKKAVYLTNVDVTRLLIDSYCNQEVDANALKIKVRKLNLENLVNIKTFKANFLSEAKNVKKNANTTINLFLDNKKLNKTPLVSCIMPTANRATYIKQAILYFLQQDYLNKELVIVYNKATDLPENLPEYKNIHFIKVTELSIGGKRNIACTHSKGEIIVQWDDDDLYGAKRITKQVQPIIEDKCDITAFENTTFFGLDDWSFWKCTNELYQQLFVKGVCGGTLVFLKKVWEIAGPYPNTSLREDADFLMQAIYKNATLKKIAPKNEYTYLRHKANTWKFKLGLTPNPDGWIKCEEFELVKQHKLFYTKKRETLKKVSCIMPTSNRSQFIEQAIQNFRNQNYVNKELIIADDGSNSIEHLVPDQENIKYFRLRKGMSLGEKRNFCCSKSTGEIIVHWDDDDWYAADWLAYQVSTLQSNNADVCGLSKLYFYDSIRQEAWLYQYPKEEKAWVAGATMAYTKNTWQKRPFKNITIGEDNAFVWQEGVSVIAHNYQEGFVASIHNENTSTKNTLDKRWHSVGVNEIHSIIKV
ncbi:glycosyltransferase family 2 protein [Tenacibaculum ovolyticum]|uniref:glycosyltransferase family 2 protein n=1 Tax=Tenacibaculum ovolyticum TaxID=104270 RepID=UPI0022F388B2|nr:glycosyltransferase family 2 protein [Tenacibaculum ovolyticum]WBX78215.1 glycosyltransferase family 2 protein [Tenacibaculum ovolyticum]